MAGLHVAFGKQLTDDVLAVYWDNLKQYDDAQFAVASKVLLDTFVPSAACPFPVIAHFKIAIGDDLETRAQTALSAVFNAIREHGAYDSVDFGDGALHAVILRYGGWPALCQYEKDDAKWWDVNEGRFIAAYKAAVKYGENAEYPTGLIEQANRMSGHVRFIPGPVLCGQAKRRQIEHEHQSALVPQVPGGVV